MAEDLGERTEQPTARRLDEARDRGQIAKSTELSGAVEVAMGIALVFVLGGWLAGAMASVMRRTLEFETDAAPLSIVDIASTLRWAGIEAAVMAAPFMGAMFVIAAIAHAGQTGLLVTTYPLVPKLDRLNPMSGLKRLLGARNAVKSGMGVAKLFIAGSIAWVVITAKLPTLAALPNLGALAGISQMMAIIAEIAIWMIAIFLVLGVIDFMFQRWQHTKDLRMTKQQVKDERRSMDGDPEVKRRRMRIAFEMAMQRIRKDVPQADVVVTNPTHFAVALRYDSATMAAPVVSAKGADLMAYRIREVAAANGVPIVERPPLARALFHNVEVGQAISAEHYEAVAEVLAYVYRLERQIA